jgi:glutathione S-transferase
MVQLTESDIRTREVLGWKGLHVFHFPLSSCSQKLRIFLNLKGMRWQSHVVDLAASENVTPWFLGVNPRGLVPVLVHDGAVHIESNDIIAYLEERFPSPPLVPNARAEATAAALRREDQLHFDLRALTFRFVFAPPVPPKSADDLQRYATAGSGTVGGVRDAGLTQQIDFWRRYAESGVTDEAARASAGRFRAAFDELERRLAGQPYLMGEALSVVDIAWFIYVNRLALAGYPVARLHPRLQAWFAGLRERREFSGEIALAPALEEQFAATRRAHTQAGKSLELVASL